MDDVFDDQEAGEGSENDYFGEEKPAATSDEQYESSYELKGKKNKKLCRHFSYNLIKHAVNLEWEEIEIANLIALVAAELELDTEKLLRLLARTDTGYPSILAMLAEKDFIFTPAQTVSAVLAHASNSNHFINLIGECFEADMFDLNDEETIQMLRDFTENTLDQMESQKLAQLICSNSTDKQTCGKILNIFTSKIEQNEAVSYIYDIITLDFFQDLRGNMQHFLYEIKPGVKEMVDALLTESYKRTSNGDLMDSDEDSEGNLVGFIADDVSGSEDDDDEEQEKTERKKKHTKNEKQKTENESKNESGSENSESSESDEESITCSKEVEILDISPSPPLSKKRKFKRNSDIPDSDIKALKKNRKMVILDSDEDDES